jgi:hypothetical protein
MFGLPTNKRVAKNRTPCPLPKGTKRRPLRRRLELEILEPRNCPSLVTVPLNFETPATGSDPHVTTSFGSVELVGHYESSVIDSDLVAAGHGGTVLESSPQSDQVGTGQIIVHGALGTEISFFYGTKNEVDSPADEGGITAYTTSQMLIDAKAIDPTNAQPRSEDVFKQFALNQGQPIGPVKLSGENYNQQAILGDYPKLGLPADGSGLIDGPGYFNQFVWTSGTKAGNVYLQSRPGATQIDDVVLKVQPVEDIFRDSRSFLTDQGDADETNQVFNFQSRAGGAGVLFEFKPVGQFGAIPLADMAAALGVKRFQFINRVIHVPQHWHVSTATGDFTVDPRTAQLISAQNVQQQQANVPLPLIDPIPSPTGREAYFFGTFGGGTQTTTGVWYKQGADNLPFYYNSNELDFRANIPQGTQRVSDDYRILFLDSPVQDSRTMNINSSNPRAGDYITFETSLVGVKQDNTFVEWTGMGTRFIWKSNATFTPSSGSAFGFGRASLTDSAVVTYPPAKAGGVFDVYSDSPDAPNAPPEATDDRVATGVGQPIAIAVTDNDDNPDFGSLDATSVTVTSGPANGTVTVDPATGVVTYTPKAGFTGADSFKYTVKDDRGAPSNEATVTVQVTEANQPPSVSAGGPYRVKEGDSVSLIAAATDPDGDPVTFRWDLDNDGTFETAGRTVNFSAAALDGPASRTVRVRADDGHGHKVIAAGTINVVNVPPTATFANNGPVSYGDAVTVLFANQADRSPADTAAGFSYAYSLDGVHFTASAAATSAFRLSVGPHTVYGRIFDRDGDYSQYNTRVVVNRANTTTALVSSTNPSTVGQSVTFTATVRSAAGTPTGSVEFFGGSASLGVVPLRGGVACVSTSALAVGSYAITAVYSGDASFADSKGALTQAVAYATAPLGDYSKAKEPGSTLPVRLKVTDYLGANLSSPSLAVWAVGIAPLGSPAPTMPAQVPGKSNKDGLFRNEAGEYAFNLKLRDASGKDLAGGDYTLFFMIGDDPTVHSLNFSVKRKKK